MSSIKFKIPSTRVDHAVALWIRARMSHRSSLITTASQWITTISRHLDPRAAGTHMEVASSSSRTEAKPVRVTRCTSTTISLSDRTPPTSASIISEARLAPRTPAPTCRPSRKDTRPQVTTVHIQVGQVSTCLSEATGSKSPRSSCRNKFKSWSRTTRNTFQRTRAPRSCTSIWSRCSISTLIATTQTRETRPISMSWSTSSSGWISHSLVQAALKPLDYSQEREGHILRRQAPMQTGHQPPVKATTARTSTLSQEPTKGTTTTPTVLFTRPPRSALSWAAPATSRLTATAPTSATKALPSQEALLPTSNHP